MGFNDPWLSCRSDTIAVISVIGSEQGNSNVKQYPKRNDYDKEVEENDLDLISEVEQYQALTS